MAILVSSRNFNDYILGQFDTQTGNPTSGSETR